MYWNKGKNPKLQMSKNRRVFSQEIAKNSVVASILAVPWGHYAKGTQKNKNKNKDERRKGEKKEKKPEGKKGEMKETHNRNDR